MLLIYPPLAKACEPPAGLALLAGALRGHGLPCTMLDANLEGQLHLLGNNPPRRDTWSSRARRHLTENLAALRDPALYAEPARYQRAVSDLSRVLGATGRDDLTVNPANYQDHKLSPVKSGDLLRAADDPAGNI
ncbi:MAG: radical SAM protein, partial [Desulfurivibrionaceae bacterium]